MTKLVSDALLEVVRDVGESAMPSETTMTVLRRTIIEGTGGEDDVETWATVGTYRAWVRNDDRGPLLYDEGTGAMLSVGRYRIHFQHTVELVVSDILVDPTGAEFIVHQTNEEATYRVFTTATARKKE